MKMYILIKDSVPDKMAPVIAAHASLACYLRFEHDNDMQKWVKDVFKKVVCRVSDEEFELARKEPRYHILRESALNNEEVCMVFCPRVTYSKAFKYFKMWRPV